MNKNSNTLEMLTINCPKCGAVNVFHFVSYYGDECFNCDYDIRTHIRNESCLETKLDRIKKLFKELYTLEPEEDKHKVRFTQIEWGLSLVLDNTERRLKRIKNFNLI